MVSDGPPNTPAFPVQNRSADAKLPGPGDATTP
jgi:hypothetical protein